MSLRIPFDSVTLAAVVAELQPLVGGRIQKIVQTDASTVVFAVYQKEEIPLLISVDPDFYRVHVATRRPQAPQEPPMFCMTLRKWILNGRITFIRQRGLDRVLDIGIASAHGDYQLVVELMGKHSNMMLVGSDRIVVAAVKWVPESKSKRPVLNGHPYLPPPFEPRPSLLEASEGDNLGQFEGVSPFLRKLIEAGTGLGSIQERIKASEFGAFYSDGNGAYPFSLEPLGLPSVERPSLSQALEQHFAESVVRHRVEQARSSLMAQLRRVLEARESAFASLEEAITAIDRAPGLQREAELLLAYQGSIPAGASEAQIWDYEGNELTLTLNPELTVVENANKLFEKAKKTKERHEEVVEQYARIAEHLPVIQGAVTRLKEATTVEEVQEIRALAEQKKWLFHQTASQKKEDRPYGGFAIRELESPAGWKVLYGTNATSNDYLTTKVAKPNDWWLHVRGQTSSHVVIQTMNQPEKVQIADIEFAAKVAVRHSVAKNASYVPVDYTLKKYVRKPRASAAGFAVYEREKVIHIDP